MEERAAVTVSNHVVDCRWFQPVKVLMEARVRWEKRRKEGREKAEGSETGESEEAGEVESEEGRVPTGLCTLGVVPGGWVSPEFCEKCNLRVPRREKRPHQLEIERVRRRLLLGEESSKLSWRR